MKKQIYIVLLMVVASVKLWSQETITIEGNGFDSFNEVKLKVYTFKSLGYETLETLRLDENGNFSVQIPFVEANLYELNFDEKEFVPLSITGGGFIKVLQNESGIHIEGSRSSQDILNFQIQNAELQAKHFGQLKADMDEAMNEKDSARIHLLQMEAENAIEEFLIEFRALIVGMGVGPAGFYALQYSDFNKELQFIESRLLAYQKEVPSSVLTRSLEKLVYRVKTTSIGNTPPDFTTLDSEGNVVSPKQFKGKVLLIDFWANWCRACRIENPQFAELHKQYKDKGFHVLSITQDVKEELWQDAIRLDGIEAFQHVFDTGNKISELYSVSSLPQNLLLNEEGIIIAKNLNAEQLERILVEDAWKDH